MFALAGIVQVEELFWMLRGLIIVSEVWFIQFDKEKPSFLDEMANLTLQNLRHFSNCTGAYGVIVMVVENGPGEPSSNSGWVRSHFI